MTPEAQHLLELLEQECDAAKNADVDRLLALQELKKEAVEQLKTVDVPDPIRVKLEASAKFNIGLMRHLAHTLRGILTGGADNTYTASGALATGAASSVRGAL